MALIKSINRDEQVPTDASLLRERVGRHQRNRATSGADEGDRGSDRTAQHPTLDEPNAGTAGTTRGPR